MKKLKTFEATLKLKFEAYREDAISIAVMKTPKDCKLDNVEEVEEESKPLPTQDIFNTIMDMVNSNNK